MGAFETSMSENVLLTAAEKHITANLGLDDSKWAAVNSHDDIKKIAQDISVEAYCVCRRIASSLQSLAFLGEQQSHIKKVMSSINGDAFESKYQEAKELERSATVTKSDLQTYLKQIFGHDNLNPLQAIHILEQAKSDLLRHAFEMSEEIPGFELVKETDVGRTLEVPEGGKGVIVRVEADKVLIQFEGVAEPQWMEQGDLYSRGAKLGDDTGTAVQANGDPVEGPSDSPLGTHDGADLERNPLMDYLQGYELSEDEQEGKKTAPSSSPSGRRPSKMTMSASYSDYDVNPDSAEGLAESFINGNISDVRQKIKNNARKFNAVLQILNEVSPESIESFQRLMARGSVGQGKEGLYKDPKHKHKYTEYDPLVEEEYCECGDKRIRPATTKEILEAEGSVDYPTDKPGATKSNPQEPETLNPTPKKIKYRLEALDEATKTWKEVGVYDSMEKANEKSDEMKAELPMTMETQVTPLVGLDKDGKPDYKTTPKAPEGDNTEQTVKEVKAAIDEDDAYEEAVQQYLDQTSFNPPEWLEPVESKELTALMAQEATALNKKQTNRLNELYDNAVTVYLEKSDFNPEDFGVQSAKREAVAPEGWEGTVKKLKKHKDKVDNPWALAWWMKGEGYKPGDKKKSSLRYSKGSWELWLPNDEESPILAQDPVIIAHVAAKKLNWSLRKATNVMRYVKEVKATYFI
jgi:hypothetical protein